ncbi:MAG: hypothetical protein ACRDQT_02165 [Gaiellaceae bacterium]
MLSRRFGIDALAREPKRVGERGSHSARRAGGPRWHLIRSRPNAAGSSPKARLPREAAER